MASASKLHQIRMGILMAQFDIDTGRTLMDTPDNGPFGRAYFRTAKTLMVRYGQNRPGQRSARTGRTT